MSELKDKKRNSKLGKRALKANISQNFIEHIGKLGKIIAKGRRNEDETRRIVIDMLKNGLGYSEDNIETELKACGKRVDIALMSKGKVIAIVECKAANVELSSAAIDQAINYATSLGVEWAIVTNGKDWTLHNIRTRKGAEPEIILMFYVEILDEDGLSKEDIEMLYLLTPQSIESGNTAEYCHVLRFYNIEFMIKVLGSNGVIEAICKEAKKMYSAKYKVEIADIDKEYVREVLLEDFHGFADAH